MGFDGRAASCRTCRSRASLTVKPSILVGLARIKVDAATMVKTSVRCFAAFGIESRLVPWRAAGPSGLSGAGEGLALRGGGVATEITLIAFRPGTQHVVGIGATKSPITAGRDGRLFIHLPFGPAAANVPVLIA